MIVELRDSLDETVGFSLPWASLLDWLPLGQWWQFLQLSTCTAVTGGHAIEAALRELHFDPTHPHGGLGGKLLNETVRRMIRFCATKALVLTCTELRRRGGGIPWMLRSRELVMYAAGHGETTASLQALLTMAPRAIGTICGHRGFSLLHEAAFCSKPKNVKLLLAMQCDARLQNMIGETALHIACHGYAAENVEIGELLLAHDATLASVADDAGLTPLETVRHAQRRLHRTVKREPTAEEQQAVARLTKLLGPDLERLPKCGTCGIRACCRRTRDGRVFCGICGVLRQA